MNSFLYQKTVTANTSYFDELPASDLRNSKEFNCIVEQKQALIEFTNKYLADAELSEEEIQPKWYLTSYWG